MQYEYLLLIDPGAKVNPEVMKIKNEFDVFGRCVTTISKPHITLMNYVQQEPMEHLIINKLDSLAKYIKPFNIELNGFGGFPAHTIFIKVETKKPIVEIVKSIRSNKKSYLQPNKISPPIFVMNPHLTIARGMSGEQYDLAFNEWKNKPYSSKFYADCMVLLKRLPGSSYKQVKSFIFGGYSPKGGQLELLF